MALQTTLAQVASLRTGKLNSNAAVENGEYPFFTCSQTTFKINQFSFDTEAVLLAGNNAAGVYPLKYYNGKFDAYQRTYIIESLDKDNLDTRYLYYVLVPLLGHFQSISIGASTQYLTKGMLDNLPLRLPNISSQRKIVSILSAYDDLIDNNRKRIALLEKAARLLYEEWFVRLQFPGHEHTPVLDGVPEGWENNTIRSCSAYVSRGISPSYDDESEGLVVNQKCVRNNQIDLSLARTQKKPFKEEKQLVKGDILINSTGTGTLGRVAQLWRIVPNCTVDSHVTIVRPKSGIGACWLGYQLSVLEPILENMGEGSTNQKELGRDRIADLKIIIPSPTIQVAFDTIVSPIKDQMLALSAQNIRLQQVRDLLLPRLMSGELAV